MQRPSKRLDARPSKSRFARTFPPSLFFFPSFSVSLTASPPDLIRMLGVDRRIKRSEQSTGRGRPLDLVGHGFPVPLSAAAGRASSKTAVDRMGRLVEKSTGSVDSQKPWKSSYKDRVLYLPHATQLISRRKAPVSCYSYGPGTIALVPQAMSLFLPEIAW